MKYSPCTPRLSILIFGALILSSTTAWAKVSYETLTFLDTDGHRYVNYATTRSDVEQYTVFLDKAENLGDYLYINPNRYQFDDSSPLSNQLKFEQGSYATISQGDYINSAQPEKSAVTVDENGVYTLRSWDGQIQPNGHYGIWNAPDSFTRFAAAWVLPDQFEVIAYTSNREGEWVQRGNTLAFFSDRVNNLVFEIAYQRRSQPAMRAIQEQLQNNSAVAVEHTADAFKVILTNEILFASGSANLSDPGYGVIAEVVDSLGPHGAYEIIVEGHTDNVPIRGALQRVYASNWELSAKRALNVVHALQQAGVAPQRLQARAFGAHKPRQPNETQEQRSANRRIELIIQPLAS